MNLKKYLFLPFALLTVCVFAEPPRHGEFSSNDAAKVWSTEGNNWVSPETFWLAYAESRGGLTWGQRTDYPPYREVNEHDTMIIELESGVCLMEFFHSRWRRANDVRRWDPRFNEYGGCPKVFD